jgi:hypothetical protein
VHTLKDPSDQLIKPKKVSGSKREDQENSENQMPSAGKENSSRRKKAERKE